MAQRIETLISGFPKPSEVGKVAAKIRKIAAKIVRELPEEALAELTRRADLIPSSSGKDSERGKAKLNAVRQIETCRERHKKRHRKKNVEWPHEKKLLRLKRHTKELPALTTVELQDEVDELDGLLESGLPKYLDKPLRAWRDANNRLIIDGEAFHADGCRFLRDLHESYLGHEQQSDKHIAVLAELEAFPSTWVKEVAAAAELLATEYLNEGPPRDELGDVEVCPGVTAADQQSPPRVNRKSKYSHPFEILVAWSRTNLRNENESKLNYIRRFVKVRYNKDFGGRYGRTVLKDSGKTTVNDFFESVRDKLKQESNGGADWSGIRAALGSE